MADYSPRASDKRKERYNMRCGKISRTTEETRVTVRLGLDGPSDVSVHTGVPFFDHMLQAMAFHAGFKLCVEAEGDVEVDAHHLVEDVGLCFGGAFKKALGEVRGVQRFGHSVIPMDESLASATVDLIGRPYLRFSLNPPCRHFGAFHTDLIEEFFRSFCHSAGITLHIRNLAGENAHHLSEAAFKAVGRALGWAVSRDSEGRVPSTKGVIDS